MLLPVASTLLERDFEVERLSERIEEAQDGRGALVALEGEAGIGKSTLLATTADRARAAGMGVLAARCGEPEREFPYGVVRQLFESAVDAPAPAERERLLAGAAALAAPALRFSEAGAPASSDPGAILHGLYWLSANLAATQPLLIAVDDAHWADAPSIAFVSYLARRVDELPILIVYTARPAEGQAAALPGARDHGLVTEVLHPLPLSESATAELVRDVHGPAGLERLAPACHHATGGNPFLLRELLRALQSEPVGDDARELDRIAALARPRSPRPCWPGCAGLVTTPASWPSRWPCSAPASISGTRRRWPSSSPWRRAKPLTRWPPPRS